MEIRTYQQEDERGWLHCRELSFLDTAYYDIVLNQKETYRNPAIELVAIEDDKVIGLLDIECEEKPMTLCTADQTLGGMITHLAVHPDYRRQGVGQALLLEAQNRLVKSEITYLEAWTRDDLWVHEWYLHQQFEKLGTYLHVYIEGSDGIASKVDGLIPVQTFCQYVGKDSEKIKKKYKRVHECTGFCKRIQ